MKELKELKEFEKWLDKARKEEDEQLPFVWELMKSPFAAYHYSLLKDKTLGEEFRRSLRCRFDEHHEQGQALLLSKLDNNEDIELQGEIIFMLGLLNDRRQRPDRDKALYYARKLALATDTYTRDRAIIVLGWIGTQQEIPLLADRLLNDPNEKCRTWAASSFMQMWLRNKSNDMIEIALPYLRQAVEQETDYAALGNIIDVIKELTGKAFNLPRQAIQNIDKERINSAKRRVQQFFNKRYNTQVQ